MAQSSSPFNKQSRMRNVARASAFGVACSLASLVLGFGFRTVFVYLLGAAYLGVNGLFTSVLLALSLAELGMTGAIVFRFYRPISMDDVHKVGQLMNFMRAVYLGIAAFIVLAGLCLVPFLGAFVKDASEVPSDVDLTVVYVLFLAQSASSYLWSYRLTLLDADQRGYVNSLVQLAVSFVSKVVQVAVLVALRDYTWMLASGIACTLAMNAAFSAWVSRRYRAVFAVREMLPREERRAVMKDVLATSCHKVGEVVLNATDNIVLSKFVGVIATGLYSNYALVITSLTTVMTKLLGSFTSSLGNAHVQLSCQENRELFDRLSFANLFFAGLASSCLYLLVDDFVEVWLGADYLLDPLAVFALALYFFLNTSRIVNGSFIQGTGLFVKDKVRPFIEAAVNVAASVVLVLHVGVAGVFLGTSISFLLTIFWREPYILHRFAFRASMRRYWVRYLAVALFTGCFCWLGAWARDMVVPHVTLLVWLAEALVAAVAFVVVFMAVFHRMEECRYILRIGRERLSKVFRR